MGAEANRRERYRVGRNSGRCSVVQRLLVEGPRARDITLRMKYEGEQFH
jgi:hypothetical protein